MAVWRLSDWGVMNKQDLSVAEALEMVLSAISVLGVDSAELDAALGRVLAADVQARDSMPPFDNSSMDGYALLASDIQNASQDNPISLSVIGDIAAGHWPDITLASGCAARIMTGAPIPPGATAVVPVEATDELWTNRDRPLPDRVKIFRSVGAGDYIRPKGDDFSAGETILQRGHLIRPQEISVLATLGVSEVQVYRQAKVAILATGDELVAVDQPLTAGKIRNSNGYAQAAQVRAAGAIPISLGVAKDSAEAVREKLQAAIDAQVDVIISSAGVSVGAFDVVKDVLDSEGEVNFWRVKMRPGKPLAFGTYAGIPFFGRPGNPVSSMLSFDRFVRPALLKMMGHCDLERRQVEAVLTERIQSDGRESYIRVILSQQDSQFAAIPTGEQGSHLITSLVKANGLLKIPEGVKVAEKGEKLTAYFLD